jgi:hypothetical protein
MVGGSDRETRGAVTIARHDGGLQLRDLRLLAVIFVPYRFPMVLGVSRCQDN